MHEACTCKRAPPERTRACTSACARACTHRECVCLPVGLHTRCVQGEHACASMRTHQEHPFAKPEGCTRGCTHCIHCTLCSPPLLLPLPPPPPKFLCSFHGDRRCCGAAVRCTPTCKAAPRAPCKGQRAKQGSVQGVQGVQCMMQMHRAKRGSVQGAHGVQCTVQCARGVQSEARCSVQGECNA